MQAKMLGKSPKAGRFNAAAAPPPCPYALPLVDPLLLAQAEGGMLPPPLAVPMPPTPPGLVDQWALALSSMRLTSGRGCVLSTDPPALGEAVDALGQEGAQRSCPNPDSKGRNLFLSTSPIAPEPQQRSPDKVEPTELARDTSTAARAEPRSAASLPASPGSAGSASAAEDKLQYCPGEMLKRSAELIPEPVPTPTTTQQLPRLLGATKKVLSSSFNAADITPEKVVKPGISKADDDHLEAPADADAKLALAGLGSSALPTVGSLTHSLGSCKPCAFVFKDGCQSGVNCRFCHLCEPGEKKRRKKDWKEARRSTTASASVAAPFMAVPAH